jgi:hypothetical protein
MAILIHSISLSMCLHLCCLEFHALLLEAEQKFKLGGYVGTHKMSISGT